MNCVVCDKKLMIKNKIGYCQAHRYMHPDVAKLRAKWAKANRKKVDPTLKRQYQVKAMYGLTNEEYKTLQDRDKTCAICNKLCGSGKRLAVDHNHVTKKVRGLLCSQCNRSLGGFKGDQGTKLLESAIQYLKDR